MIFAAYHVASKKVIDMPLIIKITDVKGRKTQVFSFFFMYQAYTRISPC